jgi:hypothetical protein
MELSLGLWGTIALGAVAWADGPNRGENPAFQDNQSGGIISRLFPDDDKGPPWRMKAKKQRDRLENSAAKKSAHSKGDSNKSKSDTNKVEVKNQTEPAPKEPSPQEKELAEVKREQADYLRRLAACDRMKEIALKNNDENLNRQADELQAQAWAIYSKHTASLSPGNAPGATRDEESKSPGNGGEGFVHDRYQTELSAKEE